MSTEDKKIWFCFCGPYDCSAWAALWTKEHLVKYFSDHEVIGPVLQQHPGFEKLRVEVNRGGEDTDGRIYAWGYDEPGRGEGPDTQHEGTAIWINDELVYNDSKFVDEDDTDHDPKECEVCSQPI